jgi:hypothetical protein
MLNLIATGLGLLQGLAGLFGGGPPPKSSALANTDAAQNYELTLGKGVGVTSTAVNQAADNGSKSGARGDVLSANLASSSGSEESNGSRTGGANRSSSGSAAANNRFSTSSGAST